MSETPIIVISSSVPKVGKTTLALNLAAALWNDNYHVYLFAPDNPEVHNFIKMRKQFCQEHQIDLPMPTLLPDIKEPDKFPAKSVIIADIPTSGASAYADIFAKLTPLSALVQISVICNGNLSTIYGAYLECQKVDCLTRYKVP